jgi:NAD-dependent DNA ligase
VLDSPEISDAEYDELMKELKQLRAGSLAQKSEQPSRRASVRPCLRAQNRRPGSSPDLR